MNRNYRILVTGSREFDDYTRVVRELVKARWSDSVIERVTRRPGDFPITVVHGDCPTGADALAARFIGVGVGGQWIAEPHPADWDRHGKAAGPVRNQEMVDLGADLCLAFFKAGAGNRGTYDCVLRAKAAGVPVREVWS